MSNNVNDSFLTIQFLACVPIHSLKLLGDNITVDEATYHTMLKDPKRHETNFKYSENVILNETIFHPIAVKYPPSINYQKSFLKSLIDKAESNAEACSEKLYTAYINLLQAQRNSDQAVYFKSYFLPDLSEFVTVQESSNIISEGTTGLVTWKGGLFLAEWCLSHPYLVEQRHVIELGCGSGVAGLVVAKSFNVKSYTFTDVHPSVLQQLKTNIGINNLDKDRLHTKCLDWRDGGKGFKSDVVLAADVVFDPDLIPPLVDTLFNLLWSHDDVVAYLSLTVRNPKTYRRFVSELDVRQLTWKEESIDEVKRIFFYERSSDICIIKVSAKR